MKLATLAFLFSLLAPFTAFAHSGVGYVTCPSGTPSLDGSLLVAPSNCALHDSTGASWTFGSVVCQLTCDTFVSGRSDYGGFNYWLYNIAKNASNVGGGFAMEEEGGKTYIQTACGDGSEWIDPATGGQIPGPLNPTTIKHVTGSDSSSYLNFSALNNGTFPNNVTYTVAAQSGIVLWADAIGVGASGGTPSGVKIVFSAGAAIGCYGSGNGGAIELHNGSNLEVDNGTVLYNHAFNGDGPYSCVNVVKNMQNVTLNGGLYMNCDMGFESGGNNGTLTLTNIEFDHNAGDTGTGASAHNIYVSGGVATDNTTVSITGGYSVCPRNVDLVPNIGASTGFMLKTRESTLTVSNWYAGEPSQHGYTDCKSGGTTIDLACGGKATFGSGSPGGGIVIEIGPDNDTLNTMIRDGDNIGSGCPAGGTGWPTNQVIIQGNGTANGCWLINDSGQNIPVGVIYAGLGSPTFDISGCKVVGFSGLGTGITNNGAANTTYTSRSAAGLPAYPYLPNPS